MYSKKKQTINKFKKKIKKEKEINKVGNKRINREL